MSPTNALVLSTVLLIAMSTIGFAVMLVPFVVPVLFSFDFANATFSSVPFLRTRTVKSTETVVPLFSLGIVHMTFWPSRFQFPVAFTNPNASTSSSVMTTMVALEGPWFVTLIVNFTKSFTLTVPVTFEYLTTVRLVTGSPVTFCELPLLFVLFVSFSWLVTLTTFGMVPLPITLAIMIKVTVSLTFKAPILILPVVSS